MTDAESKVKKGRIRHCYPRKEVYHRWIHNSEYVYSNQAYAVSGKGNYLRMFDIGKHRAVSDIEEKFPDVDVELQFGGQPVYYYIVSVE